jgi:hypothetical protein
MSFKPIPCFTGICDWPGCGADVLADGEYSGYGETEHIVDEMVDAGWRTGADGESHYCDEHPVAWASDQEQVDSMIPPFLLIHDGDTDSRDDDGRVTLILPETERLIGEGNEPLPGVPS